MKPALSRSYPIAMAHRGSQLLWPENTMLAFTEAVKLGYQYLETDVHATADGRLVCFHDPTLDRTTDGTGPVNRHTLAGLAKFDAAFRFDPMHHFPHRGTGVTIPSLKEVVTAFPDVVLTIDMKAPNVEALLVDEIRQFDLWDRVIVGSFKGDRVKRFRKLSEGRVATSAGTLETARFVLGARSGRKVNIAADALQVPVMHKGITVVTEPFIQAAHAAGKQVHVWTINDPDEMARLLDMGVDGLVTDRPDLLAELLLDRGAR